MLSAAAFSAPAASAATALYPDLRTLTPRDLRFDRADVSYDGSGVMHNVLRFTNTVWNAGDGRLEMRGQIDPTTKSGPAAQRVYNSDGTYTDSPAGQFYYHVPHQHYHYDNWGAYQLWTKADYDAWIASGRSQGAAKFIGAKTTSCVMDEEFVKTLSSTPFPAVYPSSGCMPNSSGLMVQGLSVGWGDTYDYYRSEQWIDLAQGSLADGTYVLRSVTDPTNKIYESAGKSDSTRESEQDNEATTTFTVQGGSLADSDAPTGTVTVNDVDSQTSNPNVTVKAVGRDDVSGVDQVRLSSDNVHWAAYSYTASGSTPVSIAWDLSNPTYGGSSSPGTKTVYAQFHDKSGKWSTSSATDTIELTGSSSSYSSAVKADTPVSYWRLGETSGTTASDAVGSNNGAYTNGPTLGAPSLLAADSANPAVGLDGVNDHVRVADSSSLGMTARVSLEAWIKPNALPTSGTFASVASKPEAYSLQFNGPRLEFTIMQGGGTRRRLQAPDGAVVAGRTYHVVGTYDGSDQRLYLNGAQVATAPLTGPIGTTTNPLAIGSWGGSGEYLNGTVDEVAVYSGVLSPARVQAHYDAGTSSTAPPPPVAAPSGLSATATSASQVNLTWTDNSSNETNFVVERDTDQNFTSPQTTTLGANVTSYSDTGLAAATKYYYRVKARNSTTSSGYSNVASATTASPPAPLAAPSGLSATAASSSQINLTWTDNSSNETSFVLERATDSAFTAPQTTTLGANTTSYSDTGLAAATTYYYRVRAKSSTDTSAYSNVASATTASAPPAASYASTVLADAPVSYWRLGEPSGSTAADERNANAGTYLNAPGLAAPSLLGSDTANKAVSFDGVNDSVRVPDSTSLGIASPLTLEAWIRPRSLPAAGSFATVVAKPEAYALQFNGPRLELTIMRSGTRYRLQAASGAIATGQTYHVVGTYDGTTQRLYINGAQVASAALSGGAGATTNPLSIGAWTASSEFFNGVIDDVAVYRAALSGTRVTAHYNSGR